MTGDAPGLTEASGQEIMDCLASANQEWPNSPSQGSIMSDLKDKVEEASARFSKSVAEVTETLEKESAELLNFLNDEVVPAVRQHSSNALRIAAEKLNRLANYMEENGPRPK
jgi:hypothetical protein